MSIDSQDNFLLHVPTSQDAYEEGEGGEHQENTNDKRKALDTFLLSCGLSQVKYQQRINWKEAFDRSKT